MGIYSYRFLNEGEQAEEYKRRKAAEKMEKEKQDRDNYKRRYLDREDGPGFKYSKEWYDANGDDAKVDMPKWHREYRRYDKSNRAVYDNDINNPENTDKRSERARKETGLSKSEADKTDHKYYDDMDQKEMDYIRKRGDEQAVDAVNRNMRRHPERWNGSKPKHESTLFESVHFLND